MLTFFTLRNRAVTTIKRIFFFSAIILFVSTSVHAQWAKPISGSGPQLGKDIAVDVAGNVYTTGTFAGATDFDPGPGSFILSSSCPCDESNPPKADVYLAKYDNNGNFLWALNIGGSDADISGGIALDADGNVLIAGSFFGTAAQQQSKGVYSVRLDCSRWPEGIYSYQLSDGQSALVKQLVVGKK